MRDNLSSFRSSQVVLVYFQPFCHNSLLMCGQTMAKTREAFFCRNSVVGRRPWSSCRRRSEVSWWWARNWRWSTTHSSTITCPAFGQTPPTRRWNLSAAGWPTSYFAASSSMHGSNVEIHAPSGSQDSSSRRVCYCSLVCSVLVRTIFGRPSTVRSSLEYGYYDACVVCLSVLCNMNSLL